MTELVWPTTELDITNVTGHVISDITLATPMVTWLIESLTKVSCGGASRHVTWPLPSRSSTLVGKRRVYIFPLRGPCGLKWIWGEYGVCVFRLYITYRKRVDVISVFEFQFQRDSLYKLQSGTVGKLAIRRSQWYYSCTCGSSVAGVTRPFQHSDL